MEKTKYKFLGLLAILASGIATCGYASEQRGNNSFDGIIPGLIGFALIVIGSVLLVIEIFTTIIVSSELKNEDALIKEVKINGDSSNSDLRQQLLDKLISISVISIMINIGMEYYFKKFDLNELSFILISIGAITCLIVSYKLCITYNEMGIKLWQTILVLLVVRVLFFTIVVAFVNIYNSALIIIPISYYYVIKILSNSKLIAAKKESEMS